MAKEEDDELTVGGEAVVMGKVRGKVGDKSVVIAPTDGTEVNLTRPMAVGAGAYAGSTDIEC